MYSLLVRLFIKNRGDIQNPAVRRRYGELAGALGIFLNLLLFAGKYVAGSLSGSVSVIADAFNNLSDAASSFVTLLGFKLSGKKADDGHPFGHGRIEYISGLMVSFAIFIMGFELLKTSMSKIITPQPVESGLLPLLVLAGSILIKLYMAYYNRAVGKKINSVSMTAAALDSLSDTISTGVVLIALIVMRFTGINADPYCGVLVSLFILYSGYKAAGETLSPLLGKAPDPDLVRKIHDMVMAHEGVVGVHDLMVHDYGPGNMVISLHAEVPGDGDIFALHDTIDLAERELSEKLGCTAVIHMDPIETDDTEIDKMRHALSDLVAGIDRALTIHDLRMVKGPTHTNLIFDVVVPRGFYLSDARLRELIGNLVSASMENCFAVVTVDKSYL